MTDPTDAPVAGAGAPTVLITFREVGDLLGVGRVGAARLKNDDPTFPRPVGRSRVIAGGGQTGDLWSKADVLAWFSRRGPVRQQPNGFPVMERGGKLVCARQSAEAAPPTSLGRVIPRYITERLAARTITRSTSSQMRFVLWHFARHVGVDRPVARVTRRQVEKWLQAQTVADSTVRMRLSVVRAFFSWCVEQGLAAKSPAAGVRGPKEPPRLPRGLRPSQVAEVLAACPDERTRLVVLLMCQEGLRCCEVAGLQIGRIDWEERAMVVLGKGSKERMLPISDETFEAMAVYRRLIPAPNVGPLIRAVDPRTGEPVHKGVSPGRISDLVSRMMRSAGVKASAHALRHTMATDLVRAGAHLRDVQQALGHASLQTTQVYIGVADLAELRQAMNGRRYTGAAAAGGAREEA